MIQLFNKGNADQLPVEVKVLIINGQTLVDETRKAVKEKGWEVDLTGKMQLRDDCARVEKFIKKIQKGKYAEKDVKALENAIICLQTTSKGILKKEMMGVGLWQYRVKN